VNQYFIIPITRFVDVSLTNQFADKMTRTQHRRRRQVHSSGELSLSAKRPVTKYH